MKKTKVLKFVLLVFALSVSIIFVSMSNPAVSAKTGENVFDDCCCTEGWAKFSSSFDEETGEIYASIGICNGYYGIEDDPPKIHDPLTEAHIESSYFNKEDGRIYGLEGVSITSDTVIEASVGKCKSFSAWGCDNLISLSVGKVDYDVVIGECRNLKEVNIGSAEQIVIEECESIEKITIPNGVKYLEIHNSKIKRIELPGSLENIDLSGCTNLETVVMLPGITEISRNAFEGCIKLKNVQIPNTVTFIDENAFSGCISLEEIVLSDSITSIDSGAFRETGLKKLPNLKNVTEMGACVFDSCQNLDVVTVNSKVLGRGMFMLCENLEEIILPNGITKIPSAFADGCSKLEKVNIPVGVTEIGETAFYNCVSLTKINLPNSIRLIDEYAFGASGLKDIYYDGTKAEWGEIIAAYTAFPMLVKVHYNSSSDCSCNCHKSGFMGFIWKITLFFNKLFKTNKTCACGVAHY